MSRPNYLFTENSLSDVLSAQGKAILTHIDSIQPDQLLNTGIEDWCDYCEKEYTIEPISLHEDRAHAEQSEVQIDVSQDPLRCIRDRHRPFYIPGTCVSLTIPFNGDKGLFRFRPNSFSMNPPCGVVDEHNLTISVDVLDHDSKAVKSSIDQTLSQIRSSLNTVKGQVEEFNKTVRQIAKDRLEFRRNKLLKDRGLVEALGFPLKLRDDMPPTYVVPTARRKPPSPQPVATTEAFAPDPTISTGDYNEILRIMSNMAQVLEKSPGTFKTLDEEAIRTHFLVQLNGQYQGQASGETFNSQGKTDILIKHEGKNIFIAECKFWTGPKKLLETIDQLLRYTTWRDTKTALLVFNRTKNFTAVLDSIKKTAPTHHTFKRTLQITSESCMRVVLHHPDDKNREIVLTIMAFEVPA